MRLTTLERERLLLFTAAEFARRSLRDGVLLSHPEAAALIADEMHHAARRGMTYDEVRDLGRSILDTSQVLPGVVRLLDRIQVEPMFPDGVLLVTVDHPIQPASEEAHADSSTHGHPHDSFDGGSGPGEVWAATEYRDNNPDADVVTLTVTNTLDRAVQVTSHYHFFEANRALVFDREAAYGRRLDVTGGLSVRFEPGESRDVDLIPIAGDRVVRGHHGLVDGQLDDNDVRDGAIARARQEGFGDTHV